MTYKEYEKLTMKQLKGRKAVMVRTIKNGRGEYLNENEVVEIKDKFKGFSLQSDTTGVTINRVDCHDIKLLEP